MSRAAGRRKRWRFRGYLEHLSITLARCGITGTMRFRFKRLQYPRSLPRRLVTFVLAKVTKTAPSGKASLPHKAFHAQTRKNLALQSFCRATLSLQYPVCKKLLCAAGRTRPAGFSWFRPKLPRWDRTRRPIFRKCNASNDLTGQKKARNSSNRNLPSSEINVRPFRQQVSFGKNR